MDKPIIPIETYYDGHRFRSRLEARWAVFYHTLGIKYLYEHEGYNLDGTWYLPDFYLPKQDCYVEIKSQPSTEEEKKKTALLSLYTGKIVFTFFGDVWIPDGASAYCDSPPKVYLKEEGFDEFPPSGINEVQLPRHLLIIL